MSSKAWQRLFAICDKDQVFRVGIESGGCHGFRYTFFLDNVRYDDDIEISQEGRVVVVREKFMPFLKGGVLDFEEEMMQSKFIFNNPRVSKSCGCGISFGIGDE